MKYRVKQESSIWGCPIIADEDPFHYIIEYKKHWYSSWKKLNYKIFNTKEDANDYLSTLKQNNYE